MENKQTETEKIILDQIKFRLQKRFGASSMNSMRLEIVKDVLSQSITAEFEMNILGQHNNRQYDVIFETPKNLWNYLLSVLPCQKWTKPKYKKIVKAIEFDHMVLYPMFNVITDNHQVVICSRKISEEILDQNNFR